jgi:uncharacterized protein YjbI with pentapeptide repeats
MSKKISILSILISALSINTVFAEYQMRVELPLSSNEIRFTNSAPRTPFQDYLDQLFASNPASQTSFNDTCSSYTGGMRNDNSFLTDGIVNIDANCVHFPNMDLRYMGTFDTAGIKWSNFMGSDLSNLIINASNMEYANFKDANLSGISADMTAFLNANFENTNLAGSELLNSDFGSANFKTADLSGASITNTNFTDANFENVNFSNGVLTGSSFDSANFKGTNLSNTTFAVGTNIGGATFENANLAGAQFTGSNGMSGTTFKNSDMRGAVFGAGTAFSGTVMDGVDLRGAVFSDALDITQVNFINVIYDETTVWPSWFTPPPQP